MKKVGSLSHRIIVTNSPNHNDCYLRKGKNEDPTKSGNIEGEVSVNVNVNEYQLIGGFKVRKEKRIRQTSNTRSFGGGLGESVGVKSNISNISKRSNSKHKLKTKGNKMNLYINMPIRNEVVIQQACSPIPTIPTKPIRIQNISGYERENIVRKGEISYGEGIAYYPKYNPWQKNSIIDEQISKQQPSGSVIDLSGFKNKKLQELVGNNEYRNIGREYKKIRGIERGEEEWGIAQSSPLKKRTRENHHDGTPGRMNQVKHVNENPSRYKAQNDNIYSGQEPMSLNGSPCGHREDKLMNHHLEVNTKLEEIESRSVPSSSRRLEIIENRVKHKEALDFDINYFIGQKAADAIIQGKRERDPSRSTNSTINVKAVENTSCISTIDHGEKGVGNSREISHIYKMWRGNMDGYISEGIRGVRGKKRSWSRMDLGEKNTRIEGISEGAPSRRSVMGVRERDRDRGASTRDRGIRVNTRDKGTRVNTREHTNTNTNNNIMGTRGTRGTHVRDSHQHKSLKESYENIHQHTIYNHHSNNIYTKKTNQTNLPQLHLLTSNKPPTLLQINTTQHTTPHQMPINSLYSTKLRNHNHPKQPHQLISKTRRLQDSPQHRQTFTNFKKLPSVITIEKLSTKNKGPVQGSHIESRNIQPEKLNINNTPQTNIQSISKLTDIREGFQKENCTSTMEDGILLDNEKQRAINLKKKGEKIAREHLGGLDSKIYVKGFGHEHRVTKTEPTTPGLNVRDHIGMYGKGSSNSSLLGDVIEYPEPEYKEDIYIEKELGEPTKHRRMEESSNKIYGKLSKKSSFKWTQLLNIFPEFARRGPLGAKRAHRKSQDTYSQPYYPSPPHKHNTKSLSDLVKFKGRSNRINRINRGNRSNSNHRMKIFLPEQGIGGVSSLTALNTHNSSPQVSQIQPPTAPYPLPFRPITNLNSENLCLGIGSKRICQGTPNKYKGGNNNVHTYSNLLGDNKEGGVNNLDLTNTLQQKTDSQHVNTSLNTIQVYLPVHYILYIYIYII